MTNTSSAVMQPKAANIGEIIREIEVIPITAPVEEPAFEPAQPVDVPVEEPAAV